MITTKRESLEQVTIRYTDSEREKAFAMVPFEEGWHVLRCGPHTANTAMLIAQRTVKNEPKAKSKTAKAK